MSATTETLPRRRARWSSLALFAACTAVLLTNLGMFLPPAGERFVDLLRPGSADLIPSINAAHALLRGHNPYHTRNALVVDPYEVTRGSIEGFSYLYPPSHALIYVPLALLADGNYDVAQRLQFGLEIVCIGILAACIVWILARIVVLDPTARSALFGLFSLLIGLNAGNRLGMERGQSDLITATFAWCAVVALQRRWIISTAFFCVASVLLKGYGLLFAAGLMLITARLSWQRTLIGSSCAIALLFVPVAAYLPDAFEAYAIRSAMFWSNWTNQSFANLTYSLGLPREHGRVFLAVAALGCTLSAWIVLARRFRAAPDASLDALWTSIYATAALITVLGYSLNCIAYSCVITMPGILIIALSHDQLVAQRASSLIRNGTGLWLVLTAFAFFIFDVGLTLGTKTSVLPMNAAASVAFLCTVGAVSARALARGSRIERMLLWGIAAAVASSLCVAAAWKTLARWWDAPDLAAGRPWIASSAAMTCMPSAGNCGGGALPVFFHTTLEDRPWVRIDLGSVHDVTSVRVQNRQDCCQERATPLVVEVSEDAMGWSPVARRDQVFEEWRAAFPSRRARYVRLRVDRLSVLHLQEVSVSGRRSAQLK